MLRIPVHASLGAVGPRTWVRHVPTDGVLKSVNSKQGFCDRRDVSSSWKNQEDTQGSKRLGNVVGTEQQSRIPPLLCPIVANVRNRSGKNDVVGWAGGVE